MWTNALQRSFVYTDRMLTRKPTRHSGDDLRDLPTYSIPEAALYLGIPERTLREWFSGDGPLLEPSGYSGAIPLLSFSNLVDAHIVQAARVHHGVPMGRIRAAIETAQNESSSSHPLQDDNIRIFARYLVRIEPGRGRRKRAVINLSKRGQAGIPEVVDLYTKRIAKDPLGRPVGIFPWRFWQQDERSRPVSIHPNVMSGRLVVSGTRIPVSLLLSETAAGNSPEKLARDYNLSPKVITEALSHLDTKAA
jgi:uncharacterized protein (DUF433 family)